MGNHNQGTKQVAARNHQERPLTQNGELSKQKCGSDAVADKQRGGESRHKRVYLRQLDGRKRPCAEKDEEQCQQESACRAALSVSWGNIREDLGLVARGRHKYWFPTLLHWVSGVRIRWRIVDLLRMREGPKVDKPISVASSQCVQGCPRPRSHWTLRAISTQWINSSVLNGFRSRQIAPIAAA